RDNQRVSFSGRFVNECPGLCDPIVLEVSPVSTHRIATHSAHVVMSAQRGTGKTLQNNAESPGRAVEMARLKPDTIGIRYPATIVCYIDVGNEVLAASANWIEAVGETVESSDRHRILPCESRLTPAIAGWMFRITEERQGSLRRARATMQDAEGSRLLRSA